MKFFKNEDGTMKLIPLLLIITLVTGGLFYLLFSALLKQEVEDLVQRDTVTSKTTTTEFKMCNGCSMRFTNPSIDVSTNGEFDIADHMEIDQVTFRNIKFTVDNEGLASVESVGSSYHIRTGNQEGTVILKAEYADKTAEITLNIISPSNAVVKFKYPYYFVKLGTRMTPEIEVYPYGLNTSNVKYEYDAQYKQILSIGATNGTVSTKKQAGEGIVSVNRNGVINSTKIYVVPTLIKIKIASGDNYKEAREIKPISDAFDILIIPGEVSDSFDQKDISVSFSGELGAQIAYVNKGKEVNSYSYHIETTGTGHTTMRVDLSDGSFTLFEINRQ